MSKNTEWEKKNVLFTCSFLPMTQQRDFINQYLSLLNSENFICKMAPTGSIFFNVAQTFLIWRKWWCKKKNIQGKPCTCCEFIHEQISKLKISGHEKEDFRPE